MYTILICDDEADIRAALGIYLRNEGYAVVEAENGRQALDALEREDVQLILLDVMMPQLDGISALTRLRQTSNVPVILLTAKSEDADKILGLTMGADDYVTKPFNPLEVIARVRAQLRRYASLGGMPPQGSRLCSGGIVMDDAGKSVTLDGAEVALTPTEYDILRLLLRSPGKVFSSKEIYRQVWGDTPLGAESTIAVHIRHLREKLEIEPADPRYVKVVWGQGYKLEGK